VEFKTLIDAATLQTLIGARPSPPALVVLDCRFDLTAPDAGERAYLAGHIPTARYVDLNRDLSDPVSAASGRHPLPSPERLAARFEALGIRERSQVVVYDEVNGSFAARAWWLLRWLGHLRAAVLDGGMKAWRSAGGAIESGGGIESGGTTQPADPVGGASGSASSPPVDPQAVVGSDELAALMKEGRRLLVDARAPDRFSGAVEPIDPVAGHVPGAVNHPFSANLAGDGRFLPPEELERRWRERLNGISPADTIAMCGSGVTACHNLLALEIAGLTGAKLYAGSWSEWIRDPKRPISRG
jgi:thiosulfate/3-mercaptopyruvate sulfurtransferase